MFCPLNAILSAIISIFTIVCKLINLNNLYIYSSNCNKAPMFTSAEKHLLAEILMDYLKFNKRVVKNDESIMNLVHNLDKLKKNKLVLTLQQMADEFGIDKRTLKKKIGRYQDLRDELSAVGWNFKYQRGFFPKEVEIIRKYLK